MGRFKMVKMADEDKAFEQTSKDNIGWKCPFSLETPNKKISLRQNICKGCGKLFKTNINSDYCLKCKEIFYDEP